MKFHATMKLACYVVFVLLGASSLRAQIWESVGSDSFSSITGLPDGSLALVRSPGDIVLSVDSGETWHVVYHGLESIEAIIQATNGASVAIIDSEVAVVSVDSGRTWVRTINAGWSAKNSAGSLPTSLLPIPQGINSIAYANSLFYAVGEYGQVYVSDRSHVHWNELHRSPFNSFTNGLKMNCLSSQEKRIRMIEFRSPSNGAILRDNEIFFTCDSGTSWSRRVLPDIPSTMLMISNSEALVARYVTTRDTASVLVSLVGRGDAPIISVAVPTDRPILQVGWRNKLYDDVFLLTDSEIFIVDTALLAMTVHALPLRAGEHARSASLPDPYTQYLLADCTPSRDTTVSLRNESLDTTYTHDSSAIYRSTDGGMSWDILFQDAVGLTKMFFLSAKRGMVCGSGGLILRTDDSGLHWGRWTVPQDLHDLCTVNDSVGFVVGDSGAVFITRDAGRSWWPSYPEPTFSHSTRTFTGAASPDSHTIYVLAEDACFKQRLQDPMHRARFFWVRSGQQNTITLTVSPNPATNELHLHIRAPHEVQSGEQNPVVSIRDLRGNTLIPFVECSSTASGAWMATTDVSVLESGIYTAVVTFGGASVACNVVVRR